MKLNDYQQVSQRTMPASDDKGVSNYALGLVCEAGEVGDIIKKEVFHGHEVDRKKIKDELGDVLHYLAGLATMYGFTLEQIAMTNIEKLMKRYPDGFSTERSVNRVE
ncbi:nucleotide pyrophosphohydrolase [Bacillus sp. FJAT-21945]|nr:nucleotide pyrophosphohydrolase [Bacillus sp. FJAT-21945]